ncbi:aldo/keto reductase [Oceanobacillus bengalensis]|uniref:Aldo/keto reductase n=1 Tax=Oceanobacillus bengalensis TaxID=1435466 RepID=A0A494Z3M7_9BACI|nr:aldo/keto reductase [Oceanobacillus bengalensis]RKQ16619.1 aldo/keto reductase [Oceanobacillus bengalensis]
MISSLKDTVTLNNGVKMPGFGLGVYKMDDDITVEAIQTAIKNGYRLIDTASYYKNEEAVGKGIKESGISRDEIFITSKVWNDQQGCENTLQAFDESLRKLDLDYLDLYLVHWPVSGKYKETWRALEKLYADGKVRAIGVCNFQTYHLEDLLKDCKVKPVINQVEYHPHLTQEEVKAFCEKEDIQMEAWAPLKRGGVFDEPVIVELVEKYGKTPAQIVLRWDIQNNVITIPKSATESRIIENADIFDFSLTDEEMTRIGSLNKDERTGPNPDDY